MPEKTLPKSVRYVRLINTISASLWVLISLAIASSVALPSFGRGAFVYGFLVGIFTMAMFSVPVVIFLALNKGLEKLKPSARKWQIIFSCFQLAGFPIGTVLGGICLYFMLSEEATRAFTLNGTISKSAGSD